MQGSCHGSAYPFSGASTDTLERPSTRTYQRLSQRRLDTSSAPSEPAESSTTLSDVDRDYLEAVACAKAAVAAAEHEEATERAAIAEQQLRLQIVITWLNEGQKGHSWSPRTSCTVKMALLDHVPTNDLRQALDELPQIHPPVRVWNSRRAWRRAAMRALRGLKIGVSRVRIAAVLRALASFAEHRTGRRVTSSYTTIARRAKLENPDGAGWKVVARVRAALIKVGAALELSGPRDRLSAVERMAAHAHHGGNQRAVAATTALIMPATPAAAPEADPEDVSDARLVDDPPAAAKPKPQAKGRVHLSLGSHQGRNLLFSGGNSNALKRARASMNSHTEHEPFTLAEQLLAAELVAPGSGFLLGLTSTYGPDGRHMGELCAVLRQAGVDPLRWSAADVAAALDARVAAEGRTWVTSPHNPRAYLRYWLSKIDFAAPSPTERREAAAKAAAIPDPVIVEARERAARPSVARSVIEAAKAAAARKTTRQRRT